MYEDYLATARAIPGAIGCGRAIAIGIFILYPCASLSFAADDSGVLSAVITVIGVGLIIFLMWSANKKKQKKIAEISLEKPGFKEFYAEYERQKSSESMANVLMGVLVAGAAANAIQTYQMRQDIHEIVRKMKS